MEGGEDEYMRMWMEEVKRRKMRKVKIALLFTWLWLVTLFVARNSPFLFFAVLFGGLLVMVLLFLAPTTEGEAGRFWMEEVRRRRLRK